MPRKYNRRELNNRGTDALWKSATIRGRGTEREVVKWPWMHDARMQPN